MVYAWLLITALWMRQKERDLFSHLAKELMMQGCWCPQSWALSPQTRLECGRCALCFLGEGCSARGTVSAFHVQEGKQKAAPMREQSLSQSVLRGKMDQSCLQTISSKQLRVVGDERCMHCAGQTEIVLERRKGDESCCAPEGPAQFTGHSSMLLPSSPSSHLSLLSLYVMVSGILFSSSHLPFMFSAR